MWWLGVSCVWLCGCACLCAHVCVHLSVAVADACMGCYVFDWLVVVRRMPGVLQLRERGGTWQADVDVDDGWLLVGGGVVTLTHAWLCVIVFARRTTSMVSMV